MFYLKSIQIFLLYVLSIGSKFFDSLYNQRTFFTWSQKATPVLITAITLQPPTLIRNLISNIDKDYWGRVKPSLYLLGIEARITLRGRVEEFVKKKINFRESTAGPI